MVKVMLVSAGMLCLSFGQIAYAGEGAEGATLPDRQLLGEDLTNEFRELLLSSMQATGEGVADAVSFVLEKFPELAEQLVTYKIAQALLYLLVSIVFTVLPAVGVYCFVKVTDPGEDSFKRWPEWRAFGTTLLTIISGLVTIAFVADGFSRLDTLMKLYIAPDLYLIEYARALVK